jgi:hypothetical protein
MSKKNNPQVEEVSEFDFDEMLESVGDTHRMAAYHFTQAAKHHMLAASAHDALDFDTCDFHAFRAYRHQINAIQNAEIAVMDFPDPEMDDDFEE